MARRRYGYRSYGDYDFWYFRFPQSTPRKAKGGIKAQSKRGAFGESWWAQRWIAVLESFEIGARLGRGRSYARKGQVLAVEIAKGKVSAKVQGSRPTPYRVSIEVKTLAPADWKKLAALLGQQALFAAKLLAGEMPQDIEDAFRQAGLSLFPEKLRDLKTECSCPDWSNPCKHIAAVYYLLGEEFDRDPFLIFRLRGIEREDLVSLMGAKSGPATDPPTRPARKKAASAPQPESEEPAGEPAPAEPLPADPALFWGQDQSGEDLLGEARRATVAAALCRRLGSIPFWRADTKFLDAMEPLYEAASAAGLDVLLGQAPSDAT